MILPLFPRDAKLIRKSYLDKIDSSMKKSAILLISLAIFAVACGSAGTANTANANKPPTDPATVIDRSNPLGTPKSSIAYQFELVRAGDYEKLLDCFTEKGKRQLTQPAVEKAKAEAVNISFDDIVDSITEEENSNGKFAYIKMRDHRTLAILVWHDNKWLADKVWFK
jgi:hypothetical protein